MDQMLVAASGRIRRGHPTSGRNSTVVIGLCESLLPYESHIIEGRRQPHPTTYIIRIIYIMELIRLFTCLIPFTVAAKRCFKRLIDEYDGGIAVIGAQRVSRNVSTDTSRPTLGPLSRARIFSKCRWSSG